MRILSMTLLGATLAVPTAAFSVTANLEDLVTGGGTLATGNALLADFMFGEGDFDGIEVEAIETGNTLSVGFDTPSAFANRSEYLRSGSFSIFVFDPNRQIVETRLSINALVDDVSFDPRVSVTTSLLDASRSQSFVNLTDSALVSEPFPFTETWSVSILDSGAPFGTDGSGADLLDFEVQYVLGDRVDIPAVPLPASAVLLLAGLGGLGALRRRKK